MPVVLRIKGYRFEFYSSDGDEPRHIHVKKHRKHSKFWLTPVLLAFSRRYRPHEVSEVRKLVEKHSDFLIKAWDDFFGR